MTDVCSLDAVVFPSYLCPQFAGKLHILLRGGGNTSHTLQGRGKEEEEASL